jgi:hypothetical protein
VANWFTLSTILALAEKDVDRIGISGKHVVAIGANRGHGTQKIAIKDALLRAFAARGLCGRKIW